jgi:hypothetical protein
MLFHLLNIHMNAIHNISTYDELLIRNYKVHFLFQTTPKLTTPKPTSPKSVTPKATTLKGPQLSSAQQNQEDLTTLLKMLRDMVSVETVWLVVQWTG